MNRRERLMTTMNGEAVDRPPVSFYGLNGLGQNPEDPDPFNIYSHPSWRPLIELAREKTDRIGMCGMAFKDTLPDPLDEFTNVESFIKNGSRCTTKTVKLKDRTLTSRTRRDPDVNTVWETEHLLKDVDDLKAYLELPAPEFSGVPDPSAVLKKEAALGDTGIVSIDMGDPLCAAAPLFHMGDYTVIALTEPKLFHQLLQRFASAMYARVEAFSEAVPGRIWRICGAEYASPPYLPPRLFTEYVTEYNKPIMEAISRYGGYPRIHCHGRVKNLLDDIVSMGAVGLDPIEPPPQGDVELRYVREKYGCDLVLFGNLEVSDIETVPTDKFAEKVKRALEEGTSGEGRGFVLMPAASPYGRELSALTLANYEKIVELAEAF